MMTELFSALLLIGCGIMLKSSSIMKGLFQRALGVARVVVKGDTGLTPDMDEIDVG
jgi:hypothetical protein